MHVFCCAMCMWQLIRRKLVSYITACIIHNTEIETVHYWGEQFLKKKNLNEFGEGLGHNNIPQETSTDVGG